MLAGVSLALTVTILVSGQARSRITTVGLFNKYYDTLMQWLDGKPREPKFPSSPERPEDFIVASLRYTHGVRNQETEQGKLNTLRRGVEQHPFHLPLVLHLVEHLYNLVQDLALVHDLTSQGNPWNPVKDDPELLEKELERRLLAAREIDPTNCAYDLLLAQRALQKGIQEKYSFKAGKEVYEHQIKDTEIIEQGIRFLKSAIDKPQYRHYCRERFDPIVETVKGDDVTDELARTGLRGSYLIQYAADAQSAAHSLAWYTEEEIKKGGPDRRLELAPLIVSYGNKMCQQGEHLLVLLIGNGIKKIGYRMILDHYTEQGDVTNALLVQNKLDILKEASQKVKEVPLSLATDNMGFFDREVQRYYELSDKLPQGRTFEYAAVEMLFLLLLVAILVLWTIWNVSRLLLLSLKNKRQPPHAITWTLQDHLKITGIGLFLPVLFYIFYNRTHSFRDFGLGAGNQIIHYTLWQAATWILMIPILISRMTWHNLSRKIRPDLANNPATGNRRWMAGVSLFFIVIVPVFFWIHPLRFPTPLKNNPATASVWLLLREDFLTWPTLGFWTFTALALLSCYFLLSAGGPTGMKVFARSPKEKTDLISFYRSLTPIISLCIAASCCLLLGVSRPYYKDRSREYARILNARFEEEISNSPYRIFREIADQEAAAGLPPFSK
jgi:hypothetical protein